MTSVKYETKSKSQTELTMHTMIIKNIIYLIAYANILTVRTYVLKTRTYDKMQTEIFKVGPNYL